MSTEQTRSSTGRTYYKKNSEEHSFMPDEIRYKEPEDRYKFINNEEYKDSIEYLRWLANKELINKKNENKEFCIDDLFTNDKFVNFGLCGLFSKKIGNFDNALYKCPMIRKEFDLNQKEFTKAIEQNNIVDCSNMYICKAYRLKYNLKIRFYTSQIVSEKRDVKNIIQSVKDFIIKT